jgi:ribosomal protein L30E
MNVVVALLAVTVLGGFLGILVFTVGRVDLGLVVGLTFVLAAWDILRSALSKRPRR